MRRVRNQISIYGKALWRRQDGKGKKAVLVTGLTFYSEGKANDSWLHEGLERERREP